MRPDLDTFIALFDRVPLPTGLPDHNIDSLLGNIIKKCPNSPMLGALMMS